MLLHIIRIQKSKAEYERHQHCDNIWLSAGQRAHFALSLERHPQALHPEVLSWTFTPGVSKAQPAPAVGLPSRSSIFFSREMKMFHVYILILTNYQNIKMSGKAYLNLRPVFIFKVQIIKIQMHNKNCYYWQISLWTLQVAKLIFQLNQSCLTFSPSLSSERIFLTVI